MIDIVLPNLGFGMEEGRLIRWVRRPGDAVVKGDVLVEIESDKAAVELEATSAGILDVILVEAEITVPVGTVLARLRTEADAPAVIPAPLLELPERRTTPLAERYAQEHGLNAATLTGTGHGGRVTRGDVLQALTIQVQPHLNGSGRVLAAPAVRLAAKQAGVDLATIRPTGTQGQVTRADLQRSLATMSTPAKIEVPVTPPDHNPNHAQRQEIPLSTMRRAIARRVTQSLHEIPHFYVTAEFDLTDALQKLPAGVGVNALLIHLTVQTLLTQPAFNVTYEDGHLYQAQAVDLSLAVAVNDGLLTPTLTNAGQYSLTGLAAQSRALIDRAQGGRLTPGDMQAGTFTLSNLGIIRQVDQFTAIVNPPQVGILAVGAVKERPLVINGGLHIRKTAHLTLSADHRIIDGLTAGRFMEAFAGQLTRFSI